MNFLKKIGRGAFYIFKLPRKAHFQIDPDKKGMCGWIHAWTERIPAADGESGFYSENPLKKDPWHMHRLANGDGDKTVGELVELIASMALTKIKGGMSCERKSA
jgi:hypothetical protein